jgi:hypothetical protein
MENLRGSSSSVDKRDGKLYGELPDIFNEKRSLYPDAGAMKRLD